MNANTRRSLKLRKVLFASLLALICILMIQWVFQQSKPWAVPDEYKKLKNPVVPSESTMKAAARLYVDQCAECHGERGKGDGPKAAMHRPLPADLTDARQLSAVTDGEIFYQISEGKRPMPSFKNRLTQDQRWALVLLVRSFAQPPAPPAKTPEVSDSAQAPGRKP